jgi:purine-nucleoside phosphorylase
MSDSTFEIPDSIKKHKPKIGLVLGSGLGGFAELLENHESFDYSEIAGLPESKVPGHEGKLHFGSLGGIELVVAQGRVHVYEGWTAKEVAAGVRVFHELGVSTLILTNAAGIVNANFKPGQWMLMSDHLNLVRQSPLTGDAHFIDQTNVYSPQLRELMKAESRETGSLKLFEGVYAWMNGPEYETPAEIRMLRSLGADAVGMSTVPEAIQARALGMRVLGMSCLTNYGAGLSGSTLSHGEVIKVGRDAAAELFTLLESAIPAMVEI